MKKSLQLVMWCAVFLSSFARGQVLHLAEMNSAQIKSLDRSKTVVLIPGGILEEHGPYLPVYTDGYADRYFTEQLASSVAARPGWKAVIFPEIPLGFGGANNMGQKWDFPGSFTIRLATLRSIYMDLAGDLGEQGFRWVFIVHDHGDPAHNQALTQASDYFHDTYHATMVHLFGLTTVNACYDVTARLKDRATDDEDGFTVHAGATEHSEILALHPGLVSDEYKQAPPVTGRNFVDLYDLAAKEQWPGYYGSPRRATAAMGWQVLKECSQKLNEVTERILDGADPQSLPRFYDQLDPRDALGDKTERAHDRTIESKQRNWLRKHNLE